MRELHLSRVPVFHAAWICPEPNVCGSIIKLPNLEKSTLGMGEHREKCFVSLDTRVAIATSPDTFLPANKKGEGN